MPAEVASETKPGDLLVIEAHRVGGPQRRGEIVEVIGEGEHEHYRVRWENETETIFYPSNDAKVEHTGSS
jgi:hypothetical protein